MSYVKYQQGDVVMYKVDDDTYEKRTSRSKNNDGNAFYSGGTNTSAILAFGEATGHKHQISLKELTDNAGVNLRMGWSGKAGVDVPEGFEVTGEIVTLKHEEHNPIELPPGKYIVKIVREFDHITRRTGYVAD